MGFGLDRRARSTRRKGLFARAPDPREVGERLSRLAKRALGDVVTDATPKRVTLELHPYAAPGVAAEPRPTTTATSTSCMAW